MTMFCFALLLLGIARGGFYKIVPPGSCGSAWTYASSSRWGSLTCNTNNYCSNGNFQSPINIVSSFETKDLPELVFFDYLQQDIPLVFDGVDIEGVYTKGYYTNDNSGLFYQSSGFYMRTPADIAIHGHHHPLSLNIVHQQVPSPDGSHVAYSVLVMNFDVGGSNNTLFDELVKGILYMEQNNWETTYISFPGFYKWLKDLRNSGDDSYWNFAGSLTEPPCSEIVDYTVLTKVQHISKKQFNVIQNAILQIQSKRQDTKTVRPIQRNVTWVPYRHGSAGVVVINLLFLVFSVFVTMF